ncbi:hypothetical protein I3760_05G120000 [Carya illinoinensis]|uniref:Uncharacterized protein n=2 Tax=Carya illinoinensis TaxID=32201 RepID=A0A922F1Z3_CARIL|nr:hypothetical protein I3760_05G120000 [Carya illinoinensis]KAG6712704.1 hypothetical protein I3842_05G115500 [Carya illinoinensis]KAG6712705.1 hypothetical protein I3842_05G115500 [Carya illinoinensis]
MDLSPFKRDIDELINEFAEGESTALADMKRVWISRKFSYIYEASPSTNLAFFMQSLYAHSIGYMIGNASLSHRLGGLYCLYCLYETQPFKPPFRIYLSIGELKKLTNLVVDAKGKGLKVVSPLIRRMLEKNMFLFGSVEINEGSVTETVNQLTELQNARIQAAYKKLLANTRMEHFLHMDLGMEVDLNVVQKMSTEYAEAKKLAIEEASKVADVQDIKHIAEDKNLIGDTMEKITDDWIIHKDIFYRQTRSSQHPPEEPQQLLLLKQREEQLQGDEDFDQELEQLLSEP